MGSLDISTGWNRLYLEKRSNIFIYFFATNLSYRLTNSYSILKPTPCPYSKSPQNSGNLLTGCDFCNNN